VTLTDQHIDAIRAHGDPELIEAVRTGRISIKSAALVVECRGIANGGDRVAAAKKYRAETGASLKAAQQALWPH
jgi:hypothetical protein